MYINTYNDFKNMSLVMRVTQLLQKWNVWEENINK